MQHFDRSRTLLATVLAVSSAGCAATSAASPRDHLAPGRVEPSSVEEARTLQALAELPPGSALDLRNAHVIAEAPYQAASGRTCRALYPVQGKDPGWLACELEDGWTLVPSVFPVPIANEGDGS